MDQSIYVVYTGEFVFMLLSVSSRPIRCASTREKQSRSCIHGCWKMYVPKDSKLGEGFHTNRYSIDDSLIVHLTLFGIVSRERGAL